VWLNSKSVAKNYIKRGQIAKFPSEINADNKFRTGSTINADSVQAQRKMT